MVNVNGSVRFFYTYGETGSQVALDRGPVSDRGHGRGIPPIPRAYFAHMTSALICDWWIGSA